jgi:ubiquinol-cytochrome c reductase cytochrome c1 subunit
MRKFGISIAAAALLTLGVGNQASAATAAHPPTTDYSFTGFFGSFDRAELQRGLQVYSQVCAACHGLDLVHYRDLSDLGYTDEQIKGFAANVEVTDGPNDDGDMFERPAEPSDRFKNPYSNKKMAAAVNGGKAPPDLSLIVKSRAHGYGGIGQNFLAMLQAKGYASGTDYVSHVVGTGYVEEPTPEDIKHCLAQNAGEGEDAYDARVEAHKGPPGTYFNKWFPGCYIKMPQPLYEDSVEYADGTAATPEQMAHDVAVFLTWASEPAFESRKETGIKVLLFLAVFTGVMVAVKRNVWRNVKH